MAGVKGMRKRSKAEVIARNDLGEKNCPRCGNWLPEGEYSISARLSDGLHSVCKSCDRFSRYGLTRNDVERMLDEQGHKCPICARKFLSFQDLVVDHSHACCDWYGGRKRCGNCTRGLICTPCNVKVLAVLEDSELVASANRYLRKYA